MSFTCNIGGIGDEASIKVSFPVCKYTSRSYMVGVTLNITTTKTDLFGDPKTVLTSSLSSKSSGNTVLHITDKTFLDINVLKLVGVTLKVSILFREPTLDYMFCYLYICMLVKI